MRTRRTAGLLAVALLIAPTLALATGSALGQEQRDPVPPVIVRITTPATAGTYTVDWQTLGGCDPGSGTSGMAGEITLTVAATGTPDSDPEPGELTGTPDVGVVVTRPICVYVWHVSFVEATTDANCVVGPTPFGPDDQNRIRITLTDPATSCTQRSRIVVRLNPTLPAAVDPTDHNAMLRTRFIATARRVEDAPRRCATRTAVSTIDDNETPDDTTDDRVSIELNVVRSTADGEACLYDVTLRVPRRLVATHGGREDNVFRNVDPLATIDFSVSVAIKTLYLLQAVAGDSGGASVRYELDRTCGDPDDTLPPPMLPLPVDGGIEPIESAVFVELREGRFNITAAVADDPSAPDAFDGVRMRVFDEEGETCEAVITVLDLPDSCVVEETSRNVDLARGPEPIIVEFEITCGDRVDEGDDDGANGENGDEGANGGGTG